MKYLLSLLALLCVIHASYAQWNPIGTSNDILNTNSGKVYIGGIYNSNAKFIVIQDAQLGSAPKSSVLISTTAGIGNTNYFQNNKWLVRNYTGSDWYSTRLHDGLSIDGSFLNPQVDTRTWWERDPSQGIQSWGDGLSTFLTLNQGNLGIGTTSPGAPLTVFSGTPVIQIFDIKANPGDGSSLGRLAYGSANGEFASIEAARINGSADDVTTLRFKTSWATGVGGDGNNLERMRINFNGYVGIGTSTPDQKLTVNGTIHSKEVKVNASIPPPDYVFDADYKLPTLTEIKDYIAKNHHLSEIPSASQIERDGLKLGEMNTLLLKKVEELTLHLIEKDEQLNNEYRANKNQQILIDQLKQSLEALTKEIHKN